MEVRQLKSQDWVQFKTVKVKYLSKEPDIPEAMFGNIKGFLVVKVVARNKSCSGAPAVLVVNLHGDCEFEQSLFSPVEETERTHATYWEEHIFISEHGDAPKDCSTIRKCSQLAIQSVRSRGRPVDKLFFVTDTGGENHGSTVLFQYSVSTEDYGAKSVWCPTTANHSGQPSDSTGGTFKRWLTSQATAGNLSGRNTASQLVEFCQTAPQFGEG